MSQLRTLHLGQNNIGTIAPLFCLYDLECLQVYCNPFGIKEIYSILFLTKLKKLQLYQNQITNKKYNYLTQFPTYHAYQEFLKKSAIDQYLRLYLTEFDMCKVTRSHEYHDYCDEELFNDMLGQLYQ